MSKKLQYCGFFLNNKLQYYKQDFYVHWETKKFL